MLLSTLLLPLFHLRKYLLRYWPKSTPFQEGLRLNLICILSDAAQRRVSVARSSTPRRHNNRLWLLAQRGYGTWILSSVGYHANGKTVVKYWITERVSELLHRKKRHGVKKNKKPAYHSYIQRRWLWEVSYRRLLRRPQRISANNVGNLTQLDLFM